MYTNSLGLVNKSQTRMEDNNEEIMSPKSPKTPKLSEEVSEMNLSESNENEVENDNHTTENANEPEFCEDPVITKVLKQLLLNAPAGQTQMVSTLCTELFPNYNEFIEKETQTKMESDCYISDGQLSTEHSTYVCDDSEDPFRNELKEKLDNYVKELFPGTGAFSINKIAENEWKVHILGERLKPKAFWSGHWHSTWSIEFLNDSSTDLEFKIDGKIDLTVHYHEEGSVQLSANKEIPSRVPFKAESLSKAIEKIYFKIKDSEDAVQLALNEAYQQLAENMFKKLRRQLPVTRTKMDWGKFANYNLSTELKK